MSAVSARLRHYAPLVASVVLVAAVMFTLNALAPLVADDYGIIATARGLHTPQQFAAQLWDTYRSWDGRVVGTTFAYIFGLLGKPAFNIANASAIVFFTLLLMWHGMGAVRGHLKAYVFTCLSLWLAVTAFGQAFLWYVGVTVHLWPFILILAFMLPYRLHRTGGAPSGVFGSAARAAGMALAGLVAGWCSVNVSIAAIAWVGATITLTRRRSGSSPAWMWAGLGGAAFGYIAMIAAPGNWARSDVATPGYSLLERLFRYLYFALDGGVALMVGAAVLLYLVLRLQDRADPAAVAPAALYALAALVALAVMIVAPSYSPRVLLGPVALLIASALHMLMLVDLTDTRVRAPLAALAGLGVAVVLVQLAAGAYDIRTTGRKLEARERHVIAQRDAGILDVTVEAIVPQTRVNPLWELYDVTPDPDFWSNKQIAEYYGIDSVTGVLPRE